MNLRVTRSVPVWSIVTGLIFVVAQAVALQLGQLRLNELVSDQTRIVSKLTDQLEATNKELRSNQFDIFKHDNALKDLERRMNLMERARDIQIHQPPATVILPNVRGK
jgi:hypothetical protein